MNKYQIYRQLDAIRYQFPTHINDMLIERENAEACEVFFVEVAPNDIIPTHQHEFNEQVFYVIKGKGTLKRGETKEDTPHSQMLLPGDVVLIRANQWHTVEAWDEGITYLCVDAFIKKAAAIDEPTWEDRVRTICKTNGWDFDKVKI